MGYSGSIWLSYHKTFDNNSGTIKGTEEINRIVLCSFADVYEEPEEFTTTTEEIGDGVTKNCISLRLYEKSYEQKFWKIKGMTLVP